MTQSDRAGATRARRRRPTTSAILDAVLEEARQAGLLDGGRTEHVSFRVPAALLEAARRETGVQSTTELGILALAALAQPDPAAAFMRRNRGALGPTHDLDY